MYVNDIPLFNKFFVMMGRGNGKDGFIVPLVNFFQTPLYGVKNYHVEIVANAEDQSKDTFKVAYEAMDKPSMKGKFHVTKELITNITTCSELKYNTANAKTKDGKRPGCIVLNEIHAYENYDQINVFESAFGKVRHPREFIITTNGYVREISFTIEPVIENLVNSYQQSFTPDVIGSGMTMKLNGKSYSDGTKIETVGNNQLVVSFNFF